MPDRVGHGEDPLLGTKVGRFRLTELLGKGGMGRVYLGVHEEIASRVAIKILADEYADDGGLVERFFTEARAAARVKHDAIVDVLDLDRLPTGRPYIVMEYVEGKTLRQLLQANELRLGMALDAMAEVLGALEAAHAADIIHRDLKPDNVIISPTGRAKILDFGIAKLLDRPAAKTATGITLGTPQYMAPEQIRSKPCDARTDVYAAGVMLFELVTGERPFGGDSDFEIMEQHLRAPRPSARAKAALVPVHIDAAIRTAMAIDPEDRFPSAHAMATALRTVTARRSRVPLAVLAAVTLVAAGMAVYAWTATGRKAAMVAVVPPVLVDAALPIDAVLVDAALPIDAPVLVDAGAVPEKTTPRAKEPVHRCKSYDDCPRYVCGCKVENQHFEGCSKGICETPSEACPSICAKLGGYLGRYGVRWAVTEEDCRLASRCKSDGECKMRFDSNIGANVCVTGCRDVGGCQQDGTCEDGPNGTCIATLDADCAASEECGRAGYCVARAGKCVTTDDSCAKSRNCDGGGYCRATPTGDGCVPGNDAECAASRFCATSGQCKGGPQHCLAADAAACATAFECKAEGRCAFDGGSCETSVEGCRSSEACTKYGRCDLGADGKCRK